MGKIGTKPWFKTESGAPDDHRLDAARHKSCGILLEGYSASIPNIVKISVIFPLYTSNVSSTLSIGLTVVLRVCHSFLQFVWYGQTRTGHLHHEWCNSYCFLVLPTLPALSSRKSLKRLALINRWGERE